MVVSGVRFVVVAFRLPQLRPVSENLAEESPEVGFPEVRKVSVVTLGEEGHLVSFSEVTGALTEEMSCFFVPEISSPVIGPSEPLASVIGS